MQREFIDSTLAKRVYSKYKGKCAICGFSIRAALRIHHIIPVSLGGRDLLSNFSLICSNCHALVHYFSSTNNANPNPLLSKHYTQQSIKNLIQLIKMIREAKTAIKKKRNMWTKRSTGTRSPYTIDNAVLRVANHNQFTPEQVYKFKSALSLILKHIPATVKRRCSYRLLQRGRNISIILMNCLLYRSPAYGDLGRKPRYECFIIFTPNILQLTKKWRRRKVYEFAYFDAIMLGLSLDEVISLSRSQWNDFKKACIRASQARRSRDWISNIKVS
jgi:HNH endonuclease